MKEIKKNQNKMIVTKEDDGSNEFQKVKPEINNKYKKISFFQYLSMYAFWVMVNVFVLIIATGIACLFQRNNIDFHNSMYLLIVVVLEMLVLLGLGTVKKIKKISEWIFLILNLLGIVAFFFLLQPQSLRDWMIVVLFGSVISPFCMEMLNIIKEMQILYDLTADAKNNVKEITQTISNKKKK